MSREALVKDIYPLIEFLTPFHEGGGYKDISINRKTAHKNLTHMISSPMHKIWIVEKDGEICAALGVISTELWFAKKHYATNLFLCANNDGKGKAGFLLRRMKRWVESRPLISDVTLSVTSEIGDNERVGKLYNAVGFKRLGGVYRL